MNIVVCIKQVPDVPRIRIDRQKMTIIREGVQSIINPLDSVALEASLDLRRQEGGQVTVITMGPPQSEEALREALASGADRAILLTDPIFAGADTLATSRVLARAISKLEPFPDLVLCGMQTIDSDTGQVGPQIAEELDFPQVCGVNEIQMEGNFLLVKRLSDNFLDTIRVSLPALLTVSKELCPVRHLSFGELEVAFSQGEIIQWGFDDLDLKEEEVGFKGSATQLRKLHPPPSKREGELVSGPAQILVDHLVRKLEDLGFLEEANGKE